MIEQLTTQGFDSAVAESNVPLVLDFWSPSCGPCKLQDQVLKELASEADGRFEIKKVNVWDEPDLAARFQISAVPTLLIVKHGEVVRSLVGYHDQTKLLRALQQVDENAALSRV